MVLSSHNYHVSQALSESSVTVSKWSGLLNHFWYYLAHFFWNMTGGNLPRVRFKMSTWQSVGRARSDDSSGPRDVCHAWHTELPDILAGCCHSSSAQVQYKRPAPHVTLPHTGLSATHAAARQCMQNYVFMNLIKIVISLFVRLVFCLIFHFKSNLLLIFIKIVICLYGWLI